VRRFPDLPGLASVALLYASRPRPSPTDLAGLLEPWGGRTSLTAGERQLAIDADAMLRFAGVGCLDRAAAVASFLRRRGADARVRFSVSATRPDRAHAEVQIGDEPIRPDRNGHVAFR